MIIPIRCFTCGNVLADKWIPYVQTVQEYKNKSTEQVEGEPTTTYINLSKPEKSVEGKVLDELGLHKYCCRRMIISNVHMISYIS